MRCRFIAGLVLAVMLSACGVSYAWDMKGAPKAAPDEQYRTGTEVGTYVWVWHCYDGQRVVITQYSTAMSGASAPVMVKGACGAPLPVEGTQAKLHPHRIPDGMRWPGTPSAPADPADDAKDAATRD